MNDPKNSRKTDAVPFEKALPGLPDEPAFLELARGVFTGPGGWVGAILMVAQVTLFVGGVWAGWNFYMAQDALSALHWGAPAAVALLMALMIKLSLLPWMQTHRILHELRRHRGLPPSAP
jgi:hypothetical protein